MVVQPVCHAVTRRLSIPLRVHGAQFSPQAGGFIGGYKVLTQSTPVQLLESWSAFSNVQEKRARFAITTTTRVKKFSKHSHFRLY